MLDFLCYKGNLTKQTGIDTKNYRTKKKKLKRYYVRNPFRNMSEEDKQKPIEYGESLYENILRVTSKTLTRSIVFLKNNIFPNIRR